MRDAFTQKECLLIQKLNTPQKVQNFLYQLPYNPKDTLFSFRNVARHHKAHCLEGALFTACILEQHGYPPLLLDLESKDKIDHVLFLFQKKGLYGTVGVSKDIGLHGRRPIFKTPHDLVSSYFEAYINEEACITAYATYDLRDLKNYDWRFQKKNCKKVEQTLIDLPHTPFHFKNEKYKKELERYRQYCQRYAHEKEFPMDYWKDQHTWW